MLTLKRNREERLAVEAIPIRKTPYEIRLSWNH